MGKDVVGTPKAFTLNGIPYRLAADVNISENPSQIQNTMLATSGESMLQQTKIVPVAESVVLTCRPEEKDQITSFAEGLDDVKMSYVYRNGDTNRSTGQIQIESYETETGRLTLQCQPRDRWTLYLA
jgi:hypothetical protein